MSNEWIQMPLDALAFALHLAKTEAPPRLEDSDETTTAPSPWEDYTQPGASAQVSEPAIHEAIAA